MHNTKLPDNMQLAQQYRDGQSSYDLAKLYHVSIPTILNRLKKAGCELRPLGDGQRNRLLKNVHPMLGRKHSEESKRKMREGRKDISGINNPNYGKGLPGDRNPNWKGGVSSEGNLERNTMQ